jgi:hypothetical protein
MFTTRIMNALLERRSLIFKFGCVTDDTKAGNLKAELDLFLLKKIEEQNRQIKNTINYVRRKKGGEVNG